MVKVPESIRSAFAEAGFDSIPGPVMELIEEMDSIDGEADGMFLLATPLEEGLLMIEEYYSNRDTERSYIVYPNGEMVESIPDPTPEDEDDEEEEPGLDLPTREYPGGPELW